MPSFLKSLSNFMSHASLVLGGLSLLLLVFLANAAVFARKVLDQPITWTEEASGFLLTWIIAMGIIVAEKEKEHLSIPIFVDFFPTKIRRFIAVLANLVSLFIVLAFAFLSFKLAFSTTKITNLLKIDFLYFYLPFAVGGLAIAFYTVQSILGLIGIGEREEDNA